jgi:lipopolysaccharide/colanic/teichoic acid biosynthesis glycosyltransferase
MAFENKSLEERESFSNRRLLNLLVCLVGLSTLLVVLQTIWSFSILDLPLSFLGLGLLAAFCALTFLMQRLLLYSGCGLRRAWRYRLPFLSSASLGIAFWLLPQWGAEKWNHLSILASILGGALAGALMVTAVDRGLVEINSPPAPEIKQRVQRRHLELLGDSLPDPKIKHYFDSVMALLLIIASAPLWLIIAFLIWWEDPGPIFFIKNCVGLRGINFRQLKFRTMILNAEKETGPVLAPLNDKRMLTIGRFLRKMALDELPQIINILRGEMSFVGPRPQRTVLVTEYLKDMPQYALRHKVRPGLAGLAQVAGHYYVTPLQKLRYDRIYIRRMSLWFDMRILFCAFSIVLWLRWQNNWDGHLPPWLIGS